MTDKSIRVSNFRYNDNENGELYVSLMDYNGEISYLNPDKRNNVRHAEEYKRLQSHLNRFHTRLDQQRIWQYINCTMEDAIQYLERCGWSLWWDYEI